LQRRSGGKRILGGGEAYTFPKICTTDRSFGSGKENRYPTGDKRQALLNPGGGQRNPGGSEKRGCPERRCPMSVMMDWWRVAGNFTSLRVDQVRQEWLIKDVGKAV